MVPEVVGSYPTRHPINKYPRFEKAIGKVTYSNGNTRDGSQNLMLHGRMRCGDTVWKVQSSRIFIYFLGNWMRGLVGGLQNRPGPFDSDIALLLCISTQVV